MPLLEYAQLAREDGKLFNQTFADIYFQPQSGFAESDHTFIAANRLNERFSALRPEQTFTVGEIGFGSGLNFINTVKHFLRIVGNEIDHLPATHTHPTTPKSTRLPKLYYCSVEKYPIRLAQLQQIQHDWPLPDIRQALYAQYPHNHPGFHCLTLHPQVTLLLLMGEATQMLSALSAKIDAWFLDGFAPSRNPDCWSSALFEHIARCSHPHTTLSSFSAARLLRDNLHHNGFSDEKKTGFGHKRDMITASLRNVPHQSKHWTDLPPPPTGKRVAIIGAGIAGATTAAALARHSLHIDVFHAPNQHPAASGVPLAVPYLHPGVNASIIRDYQLNAWHHALRQFTQLTARNADIFHPCRVIRQPHTARDRQRHQALFTQALLNPQQWTLAEDALHYLQAGVITPQALIDTLLSHANIRVQTRAIDSLNRDGQQWRIGDALFDCVILATGWQTSLYPDRLLGQILRPIRGQGTLLRVAPQHKPTAIYCDNHAFIPHPSQPLVYAGSSYAPNDQALDHRERDDETNKAAFLGKFQPTQEDHLADAACDIVGHFVGIRSAANDYQPLLGPVPIEADVIAKYHPWGKDSRLPIEQPLAYYPGLYVNAGYGSKGMTNAFLNAQLLSAMITGEPLPIDRKLLPYLLPARVILKHIIRRRLTDDERNGENLI